jgi:hypothetical protein
MLLTGAQFRCAALLGATLLGPAALAGCQNATQQMSLYAPFGPAAVPPPALSRVNAAPYYSPPGDEKNAPGDKSAPGSTASTGDNKLSHYDPYRGILLPGEFKTSSIAGRSADTTADVARAGDAASLAGAKPSNEEPIRIVEAAPKGIGSAIESTIARATEGQRNSGSVQFQASPPSGAVRPLEATPATITASPAAIIARSPRPVTTTTLTPLTNTMAAPAPAATVTPSSATPASGTLRMLAPPPLNTPPANTTPPGTTIPAQPAASRRLSLWDEPRDGSRVEPASYSGAVLPASPSSSGGGSWRQRSQ